ncbi:MAG: hypothetical protein LBK67_10570 [Coriobacteriales bacterium]|jgi:hypothetical protein|nr:hypothetical protein [Coriobacteriales bacterium]
MELVKKISCGAAAAAMLFCALFALDMTPLALPEHRENWTDVAGNTWTGDYLATENRYVDKMRVVFRNGAVYEGGFSNGHFNGQGRYTSATGLILEGEFVNGEFEALP